MEIIEIKLDPSKNISFIVRKIFQCLGYYAGMEEVLQPIREDWNKPIGDMLFKHTGRNINNNGLVLLILDLEVEFDISSESSLKYPNSRLTTMSQLCNYIIKCHNPKLFSRDRF